MDRRAFLAAGGLAASAPAFAAATSSGTAFSAGDPTLFSRVNFKHDGLGLNPREYSQVLQNAVTDSELHPDSYSLGGFVEALEADFATRLGKEAAIFVPTGTLANHLAIRRLAGTDRRVLVQADSHLFNDSGDCAEVLSGLNLIPMAGEDGAVRLTDIESWVSRSDSGRVETRIGVISIESPVRRAGHQFVDPNELLRISTYARERGIRLHLDGARLFNLPQHTGQDLRTIAAMFDTVYVSLWKHFNAATGAILAGSRQHLDGLFHERRRFGGALPAAWPSLAPVPHFLGSYEADYARAWAIADALFARLQRDDRFEVTTLPRGTSRVTMSIRGVNESRFCERLAEAQIDLPPSSRENPGVFSLQINPSLLRRSPEALTDAFLAAAS